VICLQILGAFLVSPVVGCNFTRELAVSMGKKIGTEGCTKPFVQPGLDGRRVAPFCIQRSWQGSFFGWWNQREALLFLICYCCLFRWPPPITRHAPSAFLGSRGAPALPHKLREKGSSCALWFLLSVEASYNLHASIHHSCNVFRGCTVVFFLYCHTRFMKETECILICAPGSVYTHTIDNKANIITMS